MSGKLNYGKNTSRRIVRLAFWRTLRTLDKSTALHGGRYTQS